jgi:peptidoglycan/xylan/chitin deacetylase (PgdA/CDA1 family)
VLKVNGSFKSVFKSLCDVTRANEAYVWLQRADLLVLCYHGVQAQPRADRWSYQNCVDADSFRSQLRWLKKNLVPTDLAGLRRWHKGDWIGRKPLVLVTFDDGYRNNLTIAAPILREEGVPGLFFLTTGFIGTPRVLWNDEVRVRVLHWPEPGIAMPSGGQVALPSELHARRAVCDKVNEACKRLTEERLVEYLEFLRGKTLLVEVMDDPDARAFMSWDEARELAGMGFEIGSHTVKHQILSRLNRARVAAELRESKATLERELGQPCSAIAFPNGSERDVNETVFEEVRAAGYDWAFMTTPVWQKAGGDPHRISRVGFPGHTDLATFKFYASGLHTRLSSAA